MAWKIELSKTADKAIRKLDKPTAARILDTLEEISQLDNPRSRGKAMTGNLAGLWRYRIGDYRAVCAIEDDRLAVLVVDVGHRKDIYKHLQKH